MAFSRRIGVDGLCEATHGRALNIDTSYSILLGQHQQLPVRVTWILRSNANATILRFSPPAPPSFRIAVRDTILTPVFLWSPTPGAKVRRPTSLRLHGFPVSGPRSSVAMFRIHIALYAGVIVIIMIHDVCRVRNDMYMKRTAKEREITVGSSPVTLLVSMFFLGKYVETIFITYKYVVYITKPAGDRILKYQPSIGLFEIMYHIMMKCYCNNSFQSCIPLLYLVFTLHSSCSLHHW